jgi:hypothetical protein
VNARVCTVDDAMPVAEAFAVKNGRFLAVGSTSDVRNLATARTEILDATGMTVTPGFIDTHSHPSGTGAGTDDDPDHIEKIGIVRTVVGGKTMFSGEA